MSDFRSSEFELSKTGENLRWIDHLQNGIELISRVQRAIESLGYKFSDEYTGNAALAYRLYELCTALNFAQDEIQAGISAELDGTMKHNDAMLGGLLHLALHTTITPRSEDTNG